MQKFISYYFIFFLSICFFSSCKKEAGEGGKASVSGVAYVRDYNGSFTVLQIEKPAFEERIYIQYGDDVNYGDQIRVNYDGRFEFKYLRPGKYKVYMNSKDPSDQDNVNPQLMMVVSKEFEITSKKQQIVLDTMFIYD
jgi:hypothetical protein